MALKDFDFKELMLKHGQYAALGVGLLILLPLTLMGMGKMIGSGRASANAKVLLDKTQQANNAIQTSQPTDDVSKPPEEFLLEIKNTPINPLAYDTENPWFVPSTFEDLKRRNPEVLMAGELKPDLVRAAIPSYILAPGGKQIMALTVKATARNKLTKRQKERLAAQEKLLKQFGLSGQGGGGGIAGMPGGFSGPGGGMPGGFSGPGGGMPGGKGMPGNPGGDGRGAGMAGGLGMPGNPAGGFSGGLGGMLGNTPGQRQPGTALRLEPIDIDKINDQTLAQEIRPFRLVVINGSFPYRKELEEFRSKLRKHSLTELMSLIDSGEAKFAFQGFQVQRRIYGPDGKVKLDWHDRTKEMIDAINGIRALAVDFEADDEKLKEYGILNSGLIAPLPMLAPERNTRYPALDIKGIDEAIANLNKQMKPDSKRPASDLARKLRGGDKDKSVFNPFDPFAPIDLDEQPTPPANKPAAPPKDADKAAAEEADAELFIPDKVLVRLVDVVEPGFTYEYRIKVIMANPNYNQPKNVAYAALAKPKQLVANDWSLVPKIDVPLDTFWYAVDSRADPEKVNLQMHRWVDYTLPSTDMSASTAVPVADWSILEKEPTYRGDYIGRMAPVELPIWSIENEAYEMYRVKGRQSRIPVDFAVKEAGAKSPAILVDFNGGKGSTVKAWGKTVKEDVPLELLVLNPDGRLIVRNSVDDEENTERSTRESDSKEWINKVKMGSSRQRPNGGAAGGVPGKGGGSGR